MASRSGIRAGAAWKGVSKKKYACKIGGLSFCHNSRFERYGNEVEVSSLKLEISRSECITPSSIEPHDHKASLHTSMCSGP